MLRNKVSLCYKILSYSNRIIWFILKICWLNRLRCWDYSYLKTTASHEGTAQSDDSSKACGKSRALVFQVWSVKKIIWIAFTIFCIFTFSQYIFANTQCLLYRWCQSHHLQKKYWTPFRTAMDLQFFRSLYHWKVENLFCDRSSNSFKFRQWFLRCFEGLKGSLKFFQMSHWKDPEYSRKF